MKRIIFAITAILLCVSAFAQTFDVTGVVSSQTDGELLTGVTVMIKGQKQGTSTDIDGRFSIKAKAGDVLRFTYIGFKPVEMKVNNAKQLNVVMAEDQTDLDEVVVLGYSQAKKITITGAASGIKADAIRRVPTSSVQNTLAGKLPGFFSQQR